MYLILFLCVTLAIALVLIKATEKKTKRKYEEFLQAEKVLKQRSRKPLDLKL